MPPAGAAARGVARGAIPATIARCAYTRANAAVPIERAANAPSAAPRHSRLLRGLDRHRGAAADRADGHRVRGIHEGGGHGRGAQAVELDGLRGRAAVAAWWAGRSTREGSRRTKRTHGALKSSAQRSLYAGEPAKGAPGAEVPARDEGQWGGHDPRSASVADEATSARQASGLRGPDRDGCRRSRLGAPARAQERRDRARPRDGEKSARGKPQRIRAVPPAPRTRPGARSLPGGAGAVPGCRPPAPGSISATTGAGRINPSNLREDKGAGRADAPDTVSGERHKNKRPHLGRRSHERARGGQEEVVLPFRVTTRGRGRPRVARMARLTRTERVARAWTRTPATRGAGANETANAMVLAAETGHGSAGPSQRPYEGPGSVWQVVSGPTGVPQRCGAFEARSGRPLGAAIATVPALSPHAFPGPSRRGLRCPKKRNVTGPREGPVGRSPARSAIEVGRGTDGQRPWISRGRLRRWQGGPCRALQRACCGRVPRIGGLSALAERHR